MSHFSRRTGRSRPLPRYAMWASNAGGPTDSELRLVASRKLAIVIFNTDRAEFAAKLKALDPGIKIYAYVCMSSVRSFEPLVPIAGAVAYEEAVGQGWVAQDTVGSPIQWGAYEGHYQATVWEASYHDAYMRHISEVYRQPLWDGIWADNDIPTLKYYTNQLIAGTTTQDQTDQKIRDGLDVLVQKAGACAKSFGKIFMPNYGDGRLTPTRRLLHAHAGGGINEEMFTAWTAATEPTLYIWGEGDWTYVVDNIREDQVDGAMTQVTKMSDVRTALYGYTSFLLRAKPGDAWQAMPPNGTEGTMPWFSFQDITIGYPIESYQVQGGGVYTRRFEHAYVAVNPTKNDQTLMLPDGSSRVMTAMTGVIT